MRRAASARSPTSPQPISGHSLRSADHAASSSCSSESGSRRCCSTLTLLVAVGPPLIDRAHRARRAVEKPPLRLVRPLHRRADRVALRQREVVAHADLVAVAEDRRAGQREHAGCRPARCGGGRRASARAGGGCRGRRAASAAPGRTRRTPARAARASRRPRSSSSWLRRKCAHCARRRQLARLRAAPARAAARRRCASA